MKVAVLGAAHTGKTRLVQELTHSLSAQGHSVCTVADLFHRWHDRHGHSPLHDDLCSLAQASADQKPPTSQPEWLMADSTPLLAAVYCDIAFCDPSLYAFALEHQRGYDLTLVAGLDLPCVPHTDHSHGVPMRAQVNARLRERLDQHSIAYTMVYGVGPQRTLSALSALQRLCAPSIHPRARTGHWQWCCENCSDSACERRLFGRLVTDSMRV